MKTVLIIQGEAMVDYKNLDTGTIVRVSTNTNVNRFIRGLEVRIVSIQYKGPAKTTYNVRSDGDLYLLSSDNIVGVQR